MNEGGPRARLHPLHQPPDQWHTDGYYHPQARRIEGMILHCVRNAGEGGVSGLVDHEMIYLALRDANPEWVRALMAPDAMTIPARARRAWRGPPGAERPGVLSAARRRPADALHRAHAQHRVEERRRHA